MCEDRVRGALERCREWLKTCDDPHNHDITFAGAICSQALGEPLDSPPRFRQASGEVKTDWSALLYENAKDCADALTAAFVAGVDLPGERVRLGLLARLADAIAADDLAAGAAVLKALLAYGSGREWLLPVVHRLVLAAHPDGGFGSTWHTVEMFEVDTTRIPVTVDCALVLAQWHRPGILRAG